MIHIICEAEQIYCEWTKAIGKTSGKKIDHSLCEINYYIREPHKIDRNTCCYHFMKFMCVHVLVELERMTEWEVAVEYIMCAPLCIRCMSTLACLADVHIYKHPRAFTFISEGMKICFKNNMHFGWQCNVFAQLDAMKKV